MMYERPNIHRLDAYTPGEQPQRGGFIKLNTNENPYPPAPAVLDAIRAVSGELLRRYPPPNADHFRAVAARVHGLRPDQVVATNGGDELLRLAVTVFCAPLATASALTGVHGAQGLAQAGGEVAGTRGLGMAEPSYSLYKVLAEIQEAAVLRVPLGDDWALPTDFAGRLNDAGCALAMLVNPHAPSGRLESVEALERIAREFKGVLLIDEAYVDFAEHDALALVRPRNGPRNGPGSGLDNVLLLRTLSKGYSLAGLRFGYGLGHPDLIAALNKAKDSYPTDIVAQAAAATALDSRAAAAQTWRKVIAERQRVTAELTRRGFTVPPSQSNFILAQVPGAPGAPAGDTGARSLYENLKARNIFVRYFDQDRLRDRLRITIGTPEQNDALLAAIDEIGKG